MRKHFDLIARRAAKQVRKSYPRTLAIAVDGSVGRGQPGPHSDIDTFVLVKPGKKPEPFSYFDRGCYVGVGFETAGKKAHKDPMDFYWARGGAFSARILYDPKGVLKRRIGSLRRSQPTTRMIENALWEAYHNIIEYAGKLRNGRVSGDEYLIRYAARIIAGRAEEAVIVLNNLSPGSENVVWHQVMAARKKPKHFRVDYPLAGGIRGSERVDQVFSSALRLAR